MGAEIAAGWVAHSLALLADAAHMFADAAALGLALFAARFARRPATTKHTYGFRRAEILAALVNGSALIGISLSILWEAFGRFLDPGGIDGRLMLITASGGLVVNAAALWLLHGERGHSLNVRGAWLHVLGDALGSVQAIAAGVLIVAFGWLWADPLASVLIAGLVIYSAVSLMREAVDVLMESAPRHVDVDAVRARLMALPGARDVHDLHVWTIGSGLVALSAHVTAPRPNPEIVRELREDLAARFGIDHTTIEFDVDGRGGECS